MGGGTNSLLALLAQLDRARHAVDAVFYHDYAGGLLGQLSRSLAALHVPLAIQPQRRQPLWAKLGKELARGVLTAARLARRRRRADRTGLAGAPQRPTAGRAAAPGRLSGAVHEQPAAIQSGRLSGCPTGRRAGDSSTAAAIWRCRRAVAAANQAARIIAVSHGIADSLRAQGVDPARIRVVAQRHRPDPASARPAACRARLGVSADTVVIGTVCRCCRASGVADLLTAVARLQSATPLRAGDWRRPQRAGASATGPRRRAGRVRRFVGFQAQVLTDRCADIGVLASCQRRPARAAGSR